jgi:hypothetical protein
MSEIDTINIYDTQDEINVCDSVVNKIDKDKDELKIPVMINELMEVVERVNKDMAYIKKNLPRIKQALNHDLKYASKHKILKKRTTKKSTGFAGTSKVPTKIAKFLKLGENETMSRTQVTSQIYSILKKRGLYDENDKRILHVDDEVMELFGLDKSVNNVTDARDPNGLTFYNFQTHIKQIYNDEETNDKIIINKDKNKDKKKNKKKNKDYTKKPLKKKPKNGKKKPLIMDT